MSPLRTSLQEEVPLFVQNSTTLLPPQIPTRTPTLAPPKKLNVVLQTVKTLKTYFVKVTPKYEYGILVQTEPYPCLNVQIQRSTKKNVPTYVFILDRAPPIVL